VILFLAAAAVLFWDQGPETVSALKDAGITEVRVPAARLSAWKSAGGVAVEAAELDGATKLLTPTVNYRTNQATASREPWVDSNGWRFIRPSSTRFYYDAPGPSAAIAAAEAAMYGGTAWIKTDAAGLKPLGAMLKFLNAHPASEGAPVADFAFVDDGTPAAGEVINLLARGNLQFKLVQAPDPKVKLNVRLGTKEYPAEDAKNPKVIAQMVRTNLTDEKRSLRIYGSPVVLGRVIAGKNGVRVHLLNYAGTARKVDGLRVRVLDRYAKHTLVSADASGDGIVDYNVESAATEFTLRELGTYTIIDLSR
jgi:hypothetical protein